MHMTNSPNQSASVKIKLENDYGEAQLYFFPIALRSHAV